jgi:branched-chain amino acid transport system substrate-binding protein
MKKTILWVVIVIVVIAGVWYVYNKKSAEKENTRALLKKEPVKIGFIGPLTGDASNLGQNSKTAVEIAVEEVNSAGGINGRLLEVIYEDGRCTGNTAINAANKLINIDKVPVILGGLCSGETQAFAGTAEQAKVVVLSYCSSAPAISKAGDYIFRDYPSDSFQGKFGADYILTKLNKKKAAVLYVNSDWGVGIKDVFIDEFKKGAGEILISEAYEQTTKDLRGQLTKIKALKPDIIYFLGYTEASIIGLKQAKELGLNIPLFGGDGWDDAKIWSEVGPAGEGAMYTTVYAPLNDVFKTKMQQKTGSTDITICTPQAYDAVKIIAQVMNKVGTNSEDIKNELYKTIYAGGVSSSKIQFDQNGDLVSANYIVKIVRNGQAVELK